VQTTLVATSLRRDALAGQRLAVSCLFAGIIAPFVFIPFVLWAGWVTPGYSQIASTFSDSAAQGQPHPEIMGTGLLLLGILLAFFAIGCFLTMPRCNRLVFVPQLICAAAIGGTGMFHDYSRLPGAPRNLEGFLHNTFASIAILSATVAILVSGLAARRQPGWSHLFLPAIGFALASATCGYLFQTVSDARDGLAERGFAVVALGWIVIVALTALWSLEDIRALRPVPTDPIPDQD
jgi:hypothetical membrane protein